MSRWRHAWRVGVLLVPMVAACSATAQAPAVPPLAEIREILRGELLPEPPEPALEDLALPDFSRQLQALDPFARWDPPPTGFDSDGDRAPTAGIGAELDAAGGRAWLLPRQGGPLARAGFRDRLELFAVDGRDVAGLGAGAVASLLRGESGTTVRLRLATDREPGPLELHLLRERSHPPDVELWPDADTAVVRITDFIAGRTRTALATTLDRLDDRFDRVVIDLRYAGGGDLYEAIDAAGMLLEPGATLCTLHARNGASATFHATSAYPGRPHIWLLVGPSTASAAEIFAGILQFHRRARLVGQPTFGKCQSQTERRLGDGSTLRFTNRDVRFPDGSSCTGSGLVPDIRLSVHQIRDLEQALRVIQNFSEAVARPQGD